MGTGMTGWTNKKDGKRIWKKGGNMIQVQKEK
jgi:hypothetical protein